MNRAGPSTSRFSRATAYWPNASHNVLSAWTAMERLEEVTGRVRAAYALMENCVMFERFWGNASTAATLERMISSHRIPQTLLLSGPEGVGKATLVRRFAERLLSQADRPKLPLQMTAFRTDDGLGSDGSLMRTHHGLTLSEKIEQDDLSREEKPCDHRGPREVDWERSAETIRSSSARTPTSSPSARKVLSARSAFRRCGWPGTALSCFPSRGHWRVFLIDHFDRASHQVADSLLKTLEEPPPHLILFMTAENPFDLPPTIRSRSVQFHLSPLSDEEMISFADSRGLKDADKAAGAFGRLPRVSRMLHGSAGIRKDEEPPCWRCSTQPRAVHSRNGFNVPRV